MAGRHRVGQRTAWITLSANLALTVLKALVGITSGSLAVLSDAAHSGSDAISTIFVLLGLKIAQQPADEKHPYGHSRAETIAAKLVALLLILVGANFAFSTIRAIVSGTYTMPRIEALWVSILSIAVKEAMYWYTYRVGKQIESPALIADAWHHRSDALSSIAAVFGVLMARMGWPIFDPIMAGLVAVVITKVGWDILTPTIDELMDAQTDSAVIEYIKKLAGNTEGVYDVRNLRVHKYGSEYHVDCIITVAPEIDVSAGHVLSHRVEEHICKGLPRVTHVGIHVEPRSSTEHT